MSSLFFETLPIPHETQLIFKDDNKISVFRSTYSVFEYESSDFCILSLALIRKIYQCAKELLHWKISTASFHLFVSSPCTSSSSSFFSFISNSAVAKVLNWRTVARRFWRPFPCSTHMSDMGCNLNGIYDKQWVCSSFFSIRFDVKNILRLTFAPKLPLIFS